MKINTYKILYVDDEKRSTKYFSRFFKNRYPIITSETTRDAFEILQDMHEEIGVIIADEKMPGERGIDFLEKAFNFQPSISRILVTAYSEHDILVNAINHGFVYKLIEKPWEVKVLDSAIKDALSLHMTMRRLGDSSLDYFSSFWTGNRLNVSIAELPYKEAKRKFVDVFEEYYLDHLLLKYGGNISRAARASGINRRTIQRFLKRIVNEKTNRTPSSLATPKILRNYLGGAPAGAPELN